MEITQTGRFTPKAVFREQLPWLTAPVKWQRLVILVTQLLASPRSGQLEAGVAATSPQTWPGSCSSSFSPGEGPPPPTGKFSGRRPHPAPAAPALSGSLENLILLDSWQPVEHVMGAQAFKGKGACCDNTLHPLLSHLSNPCLSSAPNLPSGPNRAHF